MTEYSPVEMEKQLAKMSGREPNLEQVGRVLGLKLKKGGQSDPGHALEAGARYAALSMVTESSRELLRLAQSRSGMTAEAAQAYVNETVNSAYEKAAQHSHYDSERYGQVFKVLGSESESQKRKTPLVTESQAREYDRAALLFTPDRVSISEHRGSTGRNEKPTMDERIVAVLEGR